MAEELEFVDGMLVKPPHEKAPDFVKASVSFKVAELAKWLEGKKGQEWVNIDIKSARSGKWYAAVNTYKPKAKEETPEPKSGGQVGGGRLDDDIPFSKVDWRI